MKLDLIRTLNEAVREKDEYELALAEAGIEFDMGDGESAEIENGEFADPEMSGDEEMPSDMDDFEMGSSSEEGMDIDSDIERIIAQYKGEEDDMSGQGTAEEMDDDELRDAIGDDLEQLGHDPETIADGIEQVMAGLGREELEGDDAPPADDMDMDMEDPEAMGDEMDMEMDDELGGPEDQADQM